MSGEGRRYISYLLRLWQTESDGGLVWHCSLESPQSGERLGFTSLADLCAYLEREMRDNQSQTKPRRPENGVKSMTT
jgi:hypothetical protein